MASGIKWLAGKIKKNYTFKQNSTVIISKNIFFRKSVLIWNQIQNAN